MAREKTEWVKFTVRLEPETAYLMHKYCKEPTVTIRALIKSWVKELVRKNLAAQEDVLKTGEDIKW